MTVAATDVAQLRFFRSCVERRTLIFTSRSGALPRNVWSMDGAAVDSFTPERGSATRRVLDCAAMYTSA